MIVLGIVVLGFLVVIHEGGHYLAARAFGVRVTEFMVGLPGPNIGFTHKGTKYGVTAIPLGGYARVCGMEVGEESPHLARVLESAYRRGTATMEEVALDAGISDDEAYEALEELTEWGSLAGPTKKDKYNTYRTPALVPSKKERAAGAQPVAAGTPRPLADARAFYERERAQQYRSLPFWKRSVILLAGPLTNLLFAVVAFILIFSVIGVSYTAADGAVYRMTATPLQSIQLGFMYIGQIVAQVAGLFNPVTAPEVVANSTSVVGVAVLSEQVAAYGFPDFLFFVAGISISLGVMNLIPIPPLDGGRFVVEIYQRIARRNVTMRALNTLSLVGMGLFMVLFVVMLGQDIQRIATGWFWSQG